MENVIPFPQLPPQEPQEPVINIIEPKTKEKIRLYVKEEIRYCILEIQASRMTSNTNVRWLVKEFATLFTPLNKRINFAGGRLYYTPEMDVWWEVIIYKGQVKFYLAVPDVDHVKRNLIQHIMRTWKRSNVKEVKSNIPELDIKHTDISTLTLEQHPILPLDILSTNNSPLNALLNTKYYLRDEDFAMLQIGLRPLGESWNTKMQDANEQMKKSGVIPKKRARKPTFKDFAVKFGFVVGIVAEEIMNLVGDFFIPGWEDNTEFRESLKNKAKDIKGKAAKTKKIDSEGFYADFRIVASSEDAERRRSIVRSIVGGFNGMAGDNQLVEEQITKESQKRKQLERITERKIVVKMNGTELCSLELAKVIQVPDQQAQIEHYNELSTVAHRSDADMPKEVFVDDGKGVPFAKYEDTDGTLKEIYFSGVNPNHLCMPRVVIGEPGTGKTTFAQNFALYAFNRGYGVFMIDAADGKMVQRVLDRIKPHQLDKVKIIDLLNPEFPIGLGWNEAFRGGNPDVVEDLIVDELIGYIELVSGIELKPRARQWVEAAIKAVYVTPDATLQDVENMLNNAEFRGQVIPTIEDPELRSDWERYHTAMKTEERETIYTEAFRRLAPVMRKKALKNFILQRPKKDENGNYLVDIRKWMDEGYLVLVKANETLGETIQTALVSFMIAKFNLAITSREDIMNEDDRHPCFLVLDEPDHYIKGSERWRSMLTRYRKYRCGLIFMFHGWAQIKKTDKALPELMRQAGPHYVIFQTDYDNLEELKPVIEPTFDIKKIANGMPQWHAIIRLKMFNAKGEILPPFMAQGIGKTEALFGGEWDDKNGVYLPYDNNHMYMQCSLELGRPKKEVMDEIFRNKSNAEFIIQPGSVDDSDKDVDTPKPKVEEEPDKKEILKKRRRMLERAATPDIERLVAEGREEEAMAAVEVLDEVIDEGEDA
jgi:hypothetical protein